MADKLPQSVEELLAAHKAVVDAMSPKQRTAYYAQITEDQRAHARDNPYNGGERQAQAMMPKGLAVVADADTLLLPDRSVVQNCTIDLRGAGYFCVDLDGENSTGLYREGNKVMGYGEFVYLDGLHILGPTAVFEMKARAEQAEAERDGLLRVATDTDPITAEFARAAIAAAARLTAENAVLLAERDQWRGTAMNKLEMVNSTALREKDATINSLTARVAELADAGKIAAQELRTIAGMEFMGVSAVAYNAARALEAVLAGEGGE